MLCWRSANMLYHREQRATIIRALMHYLSAARSMMERLTDSRIGMRAALERARSGQRVIATETSMRAISRRLPVGMAAFVRPPAFGMGMSS